MDSDTPETPEEHLRPVHMPRIEARLKRLAEQIAREKKGNMPPVTPSADFEKINYDKPA